MRPLMVQGCTSSAGKSLLTAALCRWFARRGVDVVPFKAQNMSNNARALPGGGEIGVAQWLQAAAAKVPPEVRMNPVLLKPEAGGSQVVVLGEVDHELSAAPWRGRSQRLWPAVAGALDELRAEHDLVILEGAGSPAEINLAADDIVNLRPAAHVDAATLLVADIDRGGAFAHLYGTWALVPADHRARLVGFVLNRFRGDASLLPPGPQDLQDLTGVPTIGVVPELAHDVPDEDAPPAARVGAQGGPRRVAIVTYPSASNLDEFAALGQVAQLTWVTHPRQLTGADLVVLPGAKDVTAARDWLTAQGFDDPLRAVIAGGTPTVAICGGLQLLGTALHAGPRVEADRAGLGVLPLVTGYDDTKRTGPRSSRFAAALPPRWQALAGLEVHGYEIRHGDSHLDVPDGHGSPTAALPDRLGWATDTVLGVYLHGLLEDAAVLRALIGPGAPRPLDASFESLADAIDDHLDTDLLLRSVEAP